MQKYGMNNNNSGNTGKVGIGGGSYSNTLKTKQPTSKYSLSELEEAKNMTKGLGKPSGNGSGNTGNYRKAFKPFENNNSNTLGSKVSNKPGFVRSQPQIEENFIVDKKQSSGIGSYNKLNFAQKYNTGNQGVTKGTGSYTNSKLAKNSNSNTNTYNNNSSYKQPSNSNLNYGGSSYGKSTQQTQSSQISQYKPSGEVKDVDNEVAMNTKR